MRVKTLVFVLVAGLVPGLLKAASTGQSASASFHFRQAQSLYLSGDLDAAMGQALQALRDDPQTPGLAAFYGQLNQEEQKLKEVNLGGSTGDQAPSKRDTNPGAWGRIWEALYRLRDNSEAHWGDLQAKFNTQSQEQQIMAQDLVRLQDSMVGAQASGRLWLSWVLGILLGLLLLLLVLVGVVLRMSRTLADLRLELETRKEWARPAWRRGGAIGKGDPVERG